MAVYPSINYLFKCITYILFIQLDRTALHWAAANGNIDIIEKLIEKGADLEAKDKVRNNTNVPQRYKCCQSKTKNKCSPNILKSCQIETETNVPRI